MQPGCQMHVFISDARIDFKLKIAYFLKQLNNPFLTGFDEFKYR